MEQVWSRGDLQLTMRWTLFNWILDVASPDAMNLHPSCLWLCFSIIDLALSKEEFVVSKDCLQVVGIAALFIAAKMCAVDVPSSHDFDFYTEDIYNKGDILKMEYQILKALQFTIYDCDEFDTNMDIGNTNPFAQYLWELCLVGCLDWHTLCLEDVWGFCQSFSHVLMNAANDEDVNTKIKFACSNEWQRVSQSVFNTLHEEKTRIEKGKRTALQRKFTRPPFTGVALGVMVNLSRIKLVYQKDPPFIQCEEEKKEPPRSCLTTSANVVTRAASKRIPPLQTADDDENATKKLLSTQQYLIKKRKSRSVSFHRMTAIQDRSGDDIIDMKRRLRHCQGITKWGKRCTRKPKVGSRYCVKHQN